MFRMFQNLRRESQERREFRRQWDTARLAAFTQRERDEIDEIFRRYSASVGL